MSNACGDRPGAIEAALAELGIEAALELNGLAYFDQAVEEQIDKLLRAPRGRADPRPKNCERSDYAS